MGFVWIKIFVSNIQSSEKEREVEVLVDTGALITVLPRSLLDELGIQPRGRRTFSTFGGGKIEREIGGAFLRYNSDFTAAPIAFGEKDDTPILGVTALESLGYVVDPVTKKLKRVDLLIL